MAEWAWEARTKAGELRKGTMAAESADIVQQRLRGQNLNVSKVRKKGKELSLKFGTGVSEKDLVIFTRQFATMIDAGLPLVQCLDILAQQGDNLAFNKVLNDVKEKVEGGSKFSEALNRHPKVFDTLYVNLVGAGEAGGILDSILVRIAVYIEKRVKLKRQVRSAMVYPIGVFCIAMAVMFVLLTWVIPSFEAMFKDFGGEDSLPALTKFVIKMSDAVVHNLVYIIGVVVGTIFGVSYSYKTPKGKHFWHKLMLGAPVFGPVIRKIAVARFTRTLGTLLGSGVPILDALEIVARSAGNVIIENAIRQTTDRIREGKPMAEPLMETGIFPPLVVQMIAVGEQTGALDQMLNKIADFYEEEVDAAVSAMTSMLEPIMMVVIGGMVGFILIAMYMPIFDIAGKIKAE